MYTTHTPLGTPEPEDKRRCSHPLTKDNCASGSRAADGTWVYDPRDCQSCGRLDCDDCAASDAVCQSCGGGICEACTATARWRRIPGKGEDREFLCWPCAEKQDAAKCTLINTVAEIALGAGWFIPVSSDSRWMDQVVADLEAAVRSAKEVL